MLGSGTARHAGYFYQYWLVSVRPKLYRLNRCTLANWLSGQPGELNEEGKSQLKKRETS